MKEIDIVVAIALAIFALKGYQNGLVHELLSLAAICAAFGVAFRYTASLTPRIADSFPGPAFIDTGVAFLVLFGLTLTTARYVVLTIRRMWLRARRSPANRVAGLSFGIFKGAIIIGCGILFLRSMAPEAYAADPNDPAAYEQSDNNNLISEINQQVAESLLAARIADLTDGVFSVLMTEAEGRVRTLVSGEPSVPADAELQ